MKRLAIVMLALAALAACAPPPPGKARLDLWLLQHVTVVHEELDVCARYRAAFKQIVQDDACLAPFSPEVREFLYYHEAGHAVDHQLWGFMRGSYGVGTEQIAQCVAEVVTGISPPYSPEQVAMGYWDCTPDQVEYFRQKMIQGGVW